MTLTTLVDVALYFFPPYLGILQVSRLLRLLLRHVTLLALIPVCFDIHLRKHLTEVLVGVPSPLSTSARALTAVQTLDLFLDVRLA